MYTAIIISATIGSIFIRLLWKKQTNIVFQHV